MPHKLKPIIIVLLISAVTAVAADQRIVMWSFKIEKSDIEVPVELKTDYGYMLLNVGTIDEPKAHYILGNRKEGTVRHFATKDAFLKSVRELAPGGVLAHYTRCLVPADLGLADEEMPYEELEKICKELGIECPEESLMKCLCPDKKYSER